MNKLKRFWPAILVILLAGALISVTSATDNTLFASQAAAAAGSPSTLNYQGQLTDIGGQPFANQAVEVSFKLYGQESGGVFDWQESHPNVLTDDDGRFSLLLNSTGSASGNLVALIQQNSALWLELIVEGETLVPRQPLASVAYAFNTPWLGISGVPAGFSDGGDDIGLAGTGLNLNGSFFEVAGSYQLPQNCANNQLAKWNSTALLWSCAADNTGGSTFTAGEGLTLSGSEFSINFVAAGTTAGGSATTAARRDHTHVGQSWNAVSDGLSVISGASTNSALEGISTNGAYGVHGISAGGIGIQGESSGTSNPGVRGVTTDSGAAGVYGHAKSASGETYGVYGVADSPAGFGIYSDGNAKVAGDLTVTSNATVAGDLNVSGAVSWSAVTGYLSIPPAAFQPAGSDDSFTNSGDSLFPERTRNGTKSQFFYAPLYLPQNATVTKATMYYFPKGTTTFPIMALKLQTAPFSSYTGSSAATNIFWLNNNNVEIADRGVVHTVSTSSMTTPTIKNDTNWYVLNLEMKQNGDLFQFLGLTVEYTTTGP